MQTWLSGPLCERRSETAPCRPQLFAMVWERRSSPAVAGVVRAPGGGGDVRSQLGIPKHLTMVWPARGRRIGHI